MPKDHASHKIAEAASLILPGDSYGAWSGFDGETETWSQYGAYELRQALWEGQQGDIFEVRFAESLQGRDREVLLLGVELLALALLPLDDVPPHQIKLLNELAAAVPGDPLGIPDVVLASVKGSGFRARQPSDDLGRRLLWLINYVRAYGTCPQYQLVIDDGYGDYLGHEDLHERCPYMWIEETPWVSADFSSRVDDDCDMRFDFDHMRWPDYLPPLDVRQAGERIRANMQPLLGDVSGDDEEGILKDLYLAKQLVGSWEELLEFRQQEWSPY